MNNLITVPLFCNNDNTICQTKKLVIRLHVQPILFLSKDSSIKANLAGYGQYYRRDMSGDNVQRCETDEYGRNKYHMCAKSGTGEQVCHTDTPAPRTPACQAFFNQTGLAYPEEFEEIQLVGESGATVDFCYGSASPVPKSRGWCETNQSYYGFKERDEAGGWGFCSGDCYLGDIAAEKDTGVLRMLRDIDVLPDSVCDAFLKGQLLHEMSLGLFFVWESSSPSTQILWLRRVLFFSQIFSGL